MDKTKYNIFSLVAVASLRTVCRFISNHCKLLYCTYVLPFKHTMRRNTYTSHDVALLVPVGTIYCVAVKHNKREDVRTRVSRVDTFLIRGC